MENNENCVCQTCLCLNFEWIDGVKLSFKVKDLCKNELNHKFKCKS